MKIALLCANASSNSLVRVYPIAKVLERHHQVGVFGFRTGSTVFAPYRHEFEYRLLEQRSGPAFLAQVRQLSEALEADAVYAFKPLPSSLWPGLLARRRRRVPLFLDIEDWEAGWYGDVPLLDRAKHLAHVERPNGLLWTWITERMVRRADRIFVVSRFLQERFGGDVLPHGADTTFFDPERWPRRAALADLGLPDLDYVVFTGTPMRNKGIDSLLKAVNLLGKPSVKVIVVGSVEHDRAYADELLARHGDRLLLIGPRPHREIPKFLAIARVVALPQVPSRETRAQVPGKVFEAMAMARPIVATAVSDLPEILDGAGTVIPPNLTESLAEALGELLDNPDLAASMGERARHRCQERYSWDAMDDILGRAFSSGDQREGQ